MYAQVRKKEKYRIGMFFTTEALLSLLLALLIIALLPTQVPNTSFMYDYYTLSDTFAVLVKGHKLQLSFFLDLGIDLGLSDIISFISQHSGKEIFISSGEKRIGPNCTPRSTIERIVITWLPLTERLEIKKFTIGICQ